MWFVAEFLPRLTMAACPPQAIRQYSKPVDDRPILLCVDAELTAVRIIKVTPCYVTPAGVSTAQATPGCHARSRIGVLGA